MTREDDVRAADRVPYRLLEAQPELDGGDGDASNLLIHGDNLEALKALLPYYAGRVKCIYIDPPYNTRSAFEHYDDNLEHSQWLAMIYPRLVLLRDLLAEDGSIWVSIDDNEGHYLKVAMDEVFGRRNFVANVLWQKRTSPDARLALGAAHDHILVFAKSAADVALNRVPLTPAQAANFRNQDNDPRGPWTSTDFTAQGWRPNQMYRITTPNGTQYDPPPGRCWSNVEPVFQQLVADSRIWFGTSGGSRPRIKNFLSEREQVSSWTWWPNEDVGHNQESKREINALFGADNAFGTPKPERLLQRILQIGSDAGDLILDSFLGSGTTAAVAQKMGRRWIGIEMGEQAVSHCKPRLDRVVEGEQGGISSAAGWSGGGGYRFYRLGEAVFDADGAITDDIRFATLAAHVWFSETATPYEGDPVQPVLGVQNGTAYALLYNGILGDRSVSGGNVLTAALLDRLREQADGWRGPWVIYGEASRLGAGRLKDENVTFKQTPYDVRAR